jgi:hypothetical protein
MGPCEMLKTITYLWTEVFTVTFSHTYQALTNQTRGSQRSKENVTAGTVTAPDSEIPRSNGNGSNYMV